MVNYKVERNRFLWIDELRTFAIITMIFANSAAYFFEGEVNVSFRIFSSLAAPLFIFLSGMNLFFSSEASSKKFITRGMYLLITASLIDILAWKIFPFGTYDVLYLIAFGIMICGVCRFGWISDLLIGVALIALSFVFKLGYNFEITEALISDNKGFSEIYNISVLKRAFIDGWFPIIPWIGYVFLGRATMVVVDRLKGVSTILGAIFVFGFSYYSLMIAELNPVRSNYIEIFYPVSPLFVLLSFSFIFLAMRIAISQKDKKSTLIGKITSLGRKSLFVYLLHCFFISMLADVFPVRGVPGFLLFCVLQLASLVALTALFESKFMIEKLYAFPRPLKVILGLK